MRQLPALLLLTALLFNQTAIANVQPASVQSLKWMAGTWAGPLGDSTIEEAWTEPSNGSIAAVVRFTKENATQMVELIVVTEEDGTLVLRLQQFSAQSAPLKESVATLYLTGQKDQQATFTAEDLSGGLKQLVYTREDEHTFSVEVTLAEGNSFKALMSAK